MHASLRWMILLGALAIFSGNAARAGAAGNLFLLNPEVQPAGQPSDQWDHCAATDGSIWLVVWADAWTDEILAMRLDSDGNLLDPVAIAVGANVVGHVATERRWPSVAWFNDCFVVAWQEYAGSGVRNGYGCRVSPDGILLDPAPFPLETWTAECRYPTVCAGRTNLLLTWSTSSGGYKHMGQMLDAQARPLGTATQLFSGLSSYLRSSVAFGDFASPPDSYLATLALSSDLRAVRVGEDGTVLDPAPLAICTNAGSQYSPAATFGPGPLAQTGWWLAWTDARNGNEDLYGCFVAQDGTVSHSSTGLALVVGDDSQFDPGIQSDGTRCALSWYDYRDPASVRASLMDANGTVADANGTIVATNEQYRPFLCPYSTDRFLSVHGYDSVFVHVLAVSGDVLSAGDQTLVSLGGSMERTPAAADDGTNFWVAFEAHPAETERRGDIALQRFTAAEIPPASPPLLVCTNASDQWGPAVAVAGDTALVVWSDERNTRDQIWGQLVDGSGQPVSTNLQIGTSTLYAYFCDVASDGTNFLAVWDDANLNQVRARIVNADASMGGVFTVGGVDISDPAIAYGAGCYLVLWADDDVIRFRRYLPDGSPLDAASSNLYVAASGTCWEPDAAFLSESGQFLVAWRDSNIDVLLGATLDAATAAIGPLITNLNTSTASSDPKVLCDGSGWLVACNDVRNGLPGIYGMRVDSTGALLDPVPFPLVYGGTAPAVASAVAPSTNALIVAAHPVYAVDGATYNTTRALGLLWTPGAPTVPDEPVLAPFVPTTNVLACLDFSQSAPGSTGYVVEACASPTGTWSAVTDCAVIDSGAGRTARWIEPDPTASNRYFRIRGN